MRADIFVGIHTAYCTDIDGTPDIEEHTVRWIMAGPTLCGHVDGRTMVELTLPELEYLTEMVQKHERLQKHLTRENV